MIVGCRGEDGDDFEDGDGEEGDKAAPLARAACPTGALMRRLGTPKFPCGNQLGHLGKWAPQKISTVSTV